MMKSLVAMCAIALLIPAGLPRAQGTISLVLGSDTAIWDGMDVASYHCTYTLSLFTDPSRNAARVMDPSFRLPLLDSYGGTVKLTWWMMAGNIFRYATNTDVPDPNTMTLHLMKQYQGASIARWGDELSLHYHTFIWSDYDGDGTYYWNQAASFAESAQDFDQTLAGFLLEEETFPVSFRSGWHAMDNEWQQRLDSLLPYCLHNDWPAHHTDPAEPLDNIYDWSRAPSSFIPFHPSPGDYQVPGACRGWNVRSAYMAQADSAFMEVLFSQAAAGADLVVCLWAHLPEADFPDNVRKVDASAHKVAPHYPGVNFRYCTAVEAMQRWRNTTDTTRPSVTVDEIPEGSQMRWSMTCNEPLFQPTPFVAVKMIDGTYSLLSCSATGSLTWETTTPVPLASLSRFGVAATDTAGNLRVIVRRYIPDDIVVDDRDSLSYAESGAWSFSVAQANGATSRYAYPGVGVSATFTAKLTKAGSYRLQEIVPKTVNASTRAQYRLILDGEPVDTAFIDQNAGSGGWVTVMEHEAAAGAEARIELSDAMSPVVAGRVLRADAIRIQWRGALTTGAPWQVIPTPATFALEQNYPNPFNAATVIRYVVPSVGDVLLTVHDVLGRTVAMLVNERKSPGINEVKFDGCRLASGVYFCRLSAGRFSKVRKMLLVR
jgi:hypothetical protein